MKKYLVIIEKSKNNYAAFSPDVEGCIATGSTVEEALAEMKSALEFHLEGLNEIPEPKGLLYHIKNGTLIYETGALFTEIELKDSIAA